jgi:hypothetical protein
MKPIEVVDELNDLIWGKNAEHEENFHLGFTYVYGTTFEVIQLENFILWNSENEERCWSEENQDYEDLLVYCIKEFNDLNKKIKRLNKLLTPKPIKYDCTKCEHSFMNPFDQYFCNKEEYDCEDNDCKGKEFIKL